MVEKKSQFELDAERLATTDQQGHRVYLYPEDVEGKWKNRREILYYFLIVLYLVLPWIKINGRPSIQLDIFNREFTFFGHTLFGVEPIFIFLTLISGLFIIAAITSLYGRVWCGWGCPQTVFIQSIFMKIERFIEGSARKRRDLDRSPMSFSKFMKKTIKWVLFTIISLHIAHTFIGYFIGPWNLVHMSMMNPENNMGVFIAVMILTAIFLLDFGWFREQFCIIACPYGRMQSVMMDTASLVVAYDEKRGEPRRSNPRKEEEGDCINCYACVKVCPTGIDIRRGTQLECIACTLCIDACDDIMTKVKRPTGLIKYTTQDHLNGVEKKSHVRPVIYFTIALAFVGALIFFLSYTANNLRFQVYRGQESPFQILANETSNKKIMNHFTLKINQQEVKAHDLEVVVEEVGLRDKIDITVVGNKVKFDKVEYKSPIFFKFDQAILQSGKREVKLNFVQDSKIIGSVVVPLVGP